MNNQNNSSYEEELEIDLGAYARIMWKRKKTISSIVILAIIISLIVGFSLPKVYQSSLIIKSGQFIESPQTTIAIFDQPTVLEKLNQQVNIPVLAEGNIKKCFSITEKKDILEIDAIGNTPNDAQKIANTVGAAILERYKNIFQDAQSNQQLEVDNLKNLVNKLEKEIGLLEKQISLKEKTDSVAQARITVALINILESKTNEQKSYQEILIKKQQELMSQTFANRIEIPANLPIGPSNKPNKLQIIIIGAVLGIFIGIFYALSAEYIKKQGGRK
ncbi:MAG: Wzz/FepE/Etk N-terminal domain-containing protein [Patescibacteria group bacterium]